jgi:hypothetical protein
MNKALQTGQIVPIKRFQAWLNRHSWLGLSLGLEKEVRREEDLVARLKTSTLTPSKAERRSMLDFTKQGCNLQCDSPHDIDYWQADDMCPHCWLADKEEVRSQQSHYVIEPPHPPRIPTALRVRTAAIDGHDSGQVQQLQQPQQQRQQHQQFDLLQSIARAFIAPDSCPPLSPNSCSSSLPSSSSSSSSNASSSPRSSSHTVVPSLIANDSECDVGEGVLHIPSSVSHNKSQALPAADSEVADMDLCID